MRIVNNSSSTQQPKKPMVSTASINKPTTAASTLAGMTKVPKKPSPIKNAARKSSGASSSNNTSNSSSTDTPQLFFKDIESLRKDTNCQKGKEVKSLASYYENLNTSSNKLPIARKKSIIPKPAPTTTTTTTTTATSSTARPASVTTTTTTTAAVVVAKPAEAVTVSSTTPPATLDENSGVPEVVEAIRETVDVYRNKIVELEKRLEAEAAVSRSLKQELLLMNEQHTYELERLHAAVDAKDDEMAKMRDEVETNNYSMLDIDQLSEELEEKNDKIKELEQELLEADELCYELRKEKQNNLELISQYRTELLDCQTLVAYYQDELGKKTAENTELQRKAQQQADEIRAYKHKIQSFLELLETQQDLRQQQQQQMQQQQQAQNKTPRKENSSTLSNQSHTPLSAKKKSSVQNNSSVNTSLFSSMNERSIHVFKSPLARAKTPKKVINSPRSMVDYI